MRMRQRQRLLVGFICAVAGSRSVGAQDCDSDGVCDRDERCGIWREEGECLRSREYMVENCPVSCREDVLIAPVAGACKDWHSQCRYWAAVGECPQVEYYCPHACNLCKTGEKFEPNSGCHDHHVNCEFWAREGECTRNEDYMTENCAKSCGICRPGKQNTRKMNKEERDRILNLLLQQSRTFGVIQEVQMGDTGQKFMDAIQGAANYMTSIEVLRLPYEEQRKCQNKHKSCTFWATRGYCKDKEEFMKEHCAPTCQTCHLTS